MRTKILGVFLVLLLVSPVIPQDEDIKEALIYSHGSEELPLPSIQLTKGEKTGVMLSSAFVVADQDINDIDATLMNWIEYSKTTNIYVNVNYTAQYNTQVRFWVMITGPEFFIWTSDWIQIKYKSNYIWYLWGEKSNFLNKSGHYKLVVVAEQKGITGGSECVSSCTFKVL